MRRFAPAFVKTASLACLSASFRGLVLFTEQEVTLPQVRNEKKYGSDMWVGDEDLPLMGTTPKEGEKPYPVTAKKQMEVYNVDQLMNAPTGLSGTNENSSVKTGKPYSKRIGFELEQRRVLKQYRSHWWISPGEIRKQNLQLKYGERPQHVALTVKTTVYNTDQLQQPDAALMQPLSAASKRPYMGEMKAVLQGHIKLNNFTTPLYLTAKQAEKFNVQIQPGAQGVPLAAREQLRKYFNIDEVIAGDIAMPAIPEAASPVYYPSGKPVTYGPMIERLNTYAAANGFKKQVWLGEYDIKKLGLKVKLGAVGVESTYVNISEPSVVFNADQTTNRFAVLKASGSVY